MHHRETDNERFMVKREIPLWGIFIFACSLIASSYSLYASYTSMAKSVDNMAIAVEKLRDNQMQYTLKDSEHDNKIANNTLQIQDMRRDIEDLKKSRTWTPK